MKPHAYLVNTARGEVIDEARWRACWRAGELAGAGLDVFEHEPAINPKLKKLRNVVLLPHMGSATIEGRIDMGEKVIINIKTFADGHRRRTASFRRCSERYDLQALGFRLGLWRLGFGLEFGRVLANAGLQRAHAI
jgi:phosphoglycerate dehydrogenase-like enzyme